jgi:hypothetical protein
MDTVQFAGKLRGRAQLRLPHPESHRRAGGHRGAIELCSSAAFDSYPAFVKYFLPSVYSRSSMKCREQRSSSLFTAEYAANIFSS